MKEILSELAHYNLWANKTIGNTLLSLPEHQLKQPLASSFPSFYDTMLHIYSAESIWWQRLKLVETVLPPAENFNGSFEAILEELNKLDKEWLNWVEKAMPHAITHVFYYRNSRKEEFRQPVYQVLIHLFNHSTYHRGQVVTMLHQLGHTNIPSTDFIHWSRKKK